LPSERAVMRSPFVCSAVRDGGEHGNPARCWADEGRATSETRSIPVQMMLDMPDAHRPAGVRVRR
jgi:hypothetical protein